MQLTHHIPALVIALCIYTPIGNAYESIESFFARDNHQDQLLLLQATGQMAKQRQQYLLHCKKAAANNIERSQCDCVQKGFTQLSDRLYYYNSVMAYEEFMARSAVELEEREALRARQSLRPNAMDAIAKQCQEQLPQVSSTTSDQ